MISKLKEGLGIQEAMDNLAAIMEIDLAAPPPLGIIKNRIVTDEAEFPRETVQWLTEEGLEAIFDILDATYRGIHQHLLHLYENPETNWESSKMRKGVQAMLSLVGESAEKMDGYLAYRLNKKKTAAIPQRTEFRALQQFYVQRFQKKFPDGFEGEQVWQKEWAENEAAPLVDLTKSGLNDFDTIRQDREYELFYIRNEEGKPYFNTELLRNVKLTCDFETEGSAFEEDPLLKIRTMQDRDLHACAGQILHRCQQAISDFYPVVRKLVDHSLAQSLSMAVMALFLAANPRHLLQNTSGKSCTEYFNDFHQFLRQAMKTSEYQKLIAYPPEKGDKTAHTLLFLIHALARTLFERAGGVKQEAIGLIHRTMRRGEEIKQKEKKALHKGETIWNQFLLDDEKFRTLLAKFPNGPLLKTLDLIREEQEEDAIVPFDPIGQCNLPSRLYELKAKSKRVELLRIPCPTRQSYVNKVEISDEFRGFLRAIALDKPASKILLINLQDRTSWKEYARSQALENLQKNAEFSQQLCVLTLPKDTDFYYQINEYLNLNKAEDFLAAFRAQLENPFECGYYLPSQFKVEELLRFAEMAFPAIHELFFDQKPSLTRRNREDFIEIFYQFLILKCIDLFQPTALSFTCKDAIDTGAAQQGLFFGFIKLIFSDLENAKEQDYLRWILYTPALFIRERAINQERLTRVISVLERLDGETSHRGKEILKTFGELYSPELFTGIEIHL